MLALIVLTCEKFTNVRDIALSCLYAPLPAPVTAMHFHPFVMMSLLHGQQCPLCLLFVSFTQGYRFGHSQLKIHFPIMQK